jgi:hypothetical protein
MSRTCIFYVFIVSVLVPSSNYIIIKNNYLADGTTITKNN